MPEDTKMITEEFLLSSLPSYEAVTATLAVITALSLPHNHNAVQAMKFPSHFADEFSMFLKDLDWLNDDIEDREGSSARATEPGHVPEYTYLQYRPND
eukprot:TRINITY_DN1257_c0_g1_i2.p1 TRINITY_DN1257_c0_g1~~TRINITY_DN1257_c0_g1_i2.p1  ORF type:complete len:98 (-),score=15.68 TRINITY_DN1257_c0_g1_i2:5-298(-)